jgi:hypothetical protein
MHPGKVLHVQDAMHLFGPSLNDDITKQLPSSNDAIIVQYTSSGQPHMEAIFTKDSSNKRNEN